VIASGSVLVWKIAESAGLSGFVYRKITGENYTVAGSGLTYTWESICTSGTASISGGNCAVNAPLAQSGYPTLMDGWELTVTTYGRNYCDPANAASCIKTISSPTMIGINGTALTASSGTPCGAVAASCRRKIRTDAQMQAKISIQPSTAAEFATPPAGASTVTAGQADNTITNAELDAALAELGATDGVDRTVSDPPAEAAVDAINQELDPGYSPDVFVILQPLPNETYSAYLTRLQADGFVGTATMTQLATNLNGYGPLAVARIVVPATGGTTTTLDPLAWPATVPTVQPTAAITIRYNSSTAPEAPTGTPASGAGATPVTVPETTIPAAGALDFTPVTDLDPGCSFPFGLICYAQDVTGWFNVTPDAPVFPWPNPEIEVLGTAYGGGGDGEVDLNVMDGYMSTLRTLISVVLWIGAVYWLAASLLGFRAGGDPGEAADEALNV
jgi:hypothetical protein